MLTLLRLNDFRNFSNVELAPCSVGINIIHGQNGSGKTSLLEAIHFLSVGESFRSSSTMPLVRHSAAKFNIFAQLQRSSLKMSPLGVEKDLHGSLRIRFDEQTLTSWVELAHSLPIRVINTHSHDLFESGPLYRRKFIDWGLFYANNDFLPCWRQYNRALKQRNAILKEKRSKPELYAWTAELVKYGLQLTEMRRNYTLALIPHLKDTASELLAFPEIQLTYHPGWDESLDFEEALAENEVDEYRIGHTQSGPHRAELDITIEAIPVKHFLSRGQQKRLICAMIVAQGRLLAQHTQKNTVYLIDDLPAELDEQGRQQLVCLLAREQAQVFITAIERNMISELMKHNSNTATKMFHVEHNEVTENS